MYIAFGKKHQMITTFGRKVLNDFWAQLVIWNQMYLSFGTKVTNTKKVTKQNVDNGILDVL